MEEIPTYSFHQTKDVMLEMVSMHLNDDDLKEKADHFIMYKVKEGFLFSELTQLHYHIDNGEKSLGMFHVSAAVEFLMLALDILDDLQDQDDTEKPWSVFPSSTSMNLSTGFLTLSMLVLKQAPYEENLKSCAFQYLYQQVLQAVKGQHQDLKHLYHTEDNFLQMIKHKSGSLMACSTLIGAVFRRTTQDELAVIQDYSENLGVTAQLANDMHGLLRMDTKNDLLQKQWTLPIMLLSKESGEQARWIQNYYEGKVDQAFMAEREESLFQWIHQSPVILYVQVLKRVYQRKTIDKMKELQVSQEWKNRMQSYIEQV
ncbi:polyprenyl synthetase family protein [Salibacterium halotolerans]|uniref:Competence protein ComQ n=1 Tax=Salibacterium halotolerans TaxID=1884432 RepID=A0A1I5X2Z2_9BACI|nr:class 1 isoprenoid biosynthesis enzyme [Salibacterium halotolerans]SFQ26353.1 competence protein ComQ [Salibacterium halotolerans]